LRSRLFASRGVTYSLHHVVSRPAKVGDKLVSTKFNNSSTRGFAAVGEPEVAVCLLPGTELAFERDVEFEPSFGFFSNRKTGQRVARFRHINEDRPSAHHDALEFPDAQTVLVTRLCEGQHATVLQLPAAPRADSAAVERERDVLATPSGLERFPAPELIQETRSPGKIRRG
jgi:hypothetical protein